MVNAFATLISCRLSSDIDPPREILYSIQHGNCVRFGLLCNVSQCIVLERTVYARTVTSDGGNRSLRTLATDIHLHPQRTYIMSDHIMEVIVISTRRAVYRELISF